MKKVPNETALTSYDETGMLYTRTGREPWKTG